MSKRTAVITIISVLAVIATAVLAYLFIFNRTNTKPEPSSAQEGPTSAPLAVTPDSEFNDASGFSFKHPKDVEVTDITPEDDESYFTKLSLSRSTEEGLIDIQDAQYKSVEKWIDQNPDFIGLELKGAVSLDGFSATQYEGPKNFVTLAIDQNVAYVITTPKSDYWDQVHDMVVSTFSFAGSETKSNGSASSGGSTNVVYEAEEVIE